MESIEELRKMDDDELIALGNGQYGRDYRHNSIADDIEREIADKYMKLPVDAEGVPIHIGDMLETSEYGKRFTCTGYSYQTAGYDKPHWSIAYCYDDYDGTTEFVSMHSCHHVKLRTIEDVLHDVVRDSRSVRYADGSNVLTNDLIAKYADELRSMRVVDE